MTKQIHLAAHFPGVNNTTVWSDPRAGSHIEFSSFEHLAQTAERARFDFLFLAEGLKAPTRFASPSSAAARRTWADPPASAIMLRRRRNVHPQSACLGIPAG